MLHRLVESIRALVEAFRRARSGGLTRGPRSQVRDAHAGGDCRRTVREPATSSPLRTMVVWRARASRVRRCRHGCAAWF
jgi:hypothetical protein